MRTLAHPLSRWLAAMSCLLAIVLVVPAVAQEQYPCEETLVEVLFRPDSRVRLIEGDLVDLEGDATAGLDAVLMPWPEWEWLRYTDVPESEVDVMVEEARLNTGEDLYDLNNIYRLRVGPGGDMHLLAADLEMLPGVMRSYAVPLAQPAPTPDFEPQQGYLGPASNNPAGVDAIFAGGMLGGDGSGVTVCDLEYSWNDSHDDVTKAVGSQIVTQPIVDPFADTNHGTAVIGELVADANGWGVTGVCPGAGLLTCATNYGSPATWNVPGAITLAAWTLAPGDVMLLEQQWEYTPFAGDFIPIEWWGSNAPQAQTQNAVYLAIQNAVALGINVVEAGGNGGVDTDQLTWAGDSGAVIVGAGAATPSTDRQRLSFSSYGSRYDVQGWGENVVTCGYGDLWNSEGPNRLFTATFNGTSSASPIVAGCAANIVGYAVANTGAVPTPAQVRTWLATYGTPQVTPPPGHIGPRPDLAATLPTIQPPMFTDITAGALAGTGGNVSACWGDYDRDGDADLYSANALGPNDLVRNDLVGGFWATPPSAAQSPLPSADAAWADYDGDGDLDVYLVNTTAPNQLLRNDGADTFTDVTMPPLDHPGHGECADWADVDRDGRLDLYLGNGNGEPNHLFLNAPGGVFLDATHPPLDDMSWTKDVQFCDFDADGDADLLVCNAGTSDRLLVNDGTGFFTDLTPAALQVPINTFSGAWGDVDNDGWLDLYLVHYMAANRLLLNQGGTGVFVDVTVPPLDAPGYNEASAWGDIDNDGWLDLYLTRSTGSNVLLQNVGGGFTDVSASPVADASVSHGTAWADADLDGDLDLYLANQGSSNRLFRNDVGATSGNWLHVDLLGDLANTFAVGARVEVYASNGLQVQEVGTGAGRRGENDLLLHFGLGQAGIVDSLKVHWPHGAVTDTTLLAVNVRHVFAEPPVTAVGDDVLPSALVLHRAAPNPFNPRTEVRFDLPRDATVTLAVHDLAGRRVRTLRDAARLPAGRHAAVWDGADGAGRRLASGAYLLRLEVQGEIRTTRVTLIK